MGGGITVTMALVDCVPVILFMVAAVILQRDLYDLLPKGAYSLVAAGSIMAFLGGLMKALWKILYATGVCDYVLLDHALFVLQGPGFLLFFLGLTGLFWWGRASGENNAEPAALAAGAAPAATTTSIPFIVMQVVGLGGAQVLLAVAGARRGSRLAPVAFALAFVFMLGMGYLGAKFGDSSSMHWVAQLTNTLSMACFLWGTLLLHKVGYVSGTREER